jgi:hypothetical protein
MRAVLAIVAAISLGGCFAQKEWVRADGVYVPEPQFRAAFAQCNAVADRARIAAQPQRSVAPVVVNNGIIVAGRNNGPPDLPFITEGPDMSGASSDAAFGGCMAQAGYILVDSKRR